MEKLSNIVLASDPQFEKKKYDLVFIGGGPSTISFISYIFQKKLTDKFFNSLNILIIERDENFGSGCLGKYGINTNTSSEGFPRLICYSDGESKEKAAKFALSPSKNNMKASNNYNNGNNGNKKLKQEKIIELEKFENPKEKLKFKKIPLFIELFSSSSVQTLLAIGNRPAPLSLVGYFLDSLGNFIVHHVKSTYNKNILMNNSEVKSIKMYNNEEFGIVVKKVNSDVNYLIKTRCLVLSMGGKQAYENAYYTQIVTLQGHEKVFNSDYILKEDGYKKIINTLTHNTDTANVEDSESCNNNSISNINLNQNLNQIQIQIPNKKKKKVVIIGGSHSGFSSAWIILNGPSTYNNLKIGTDYEPKKEEKCEKCQPLSAKITNSNSECKCAFYGKVSHRNWELTSLPSLSSSVSSIELEVTILYRDSIRVYYPSEEEALSENYINYNPKEACNKQGRVYPFIGIRGDAKELYNKFLRGEESRLKLVKTQTNREQMPYLKEADVVIWACGYVSNTLPFNDARNHPVEFITDEVGTIEVDKQLQLINKNKTAIRNLYGIGQGYSTKTPEIINGKKARADSIHIYNTYIASKLYRSLEYLINKVAIENNSRGNLNMAVNLKRNSETEQKIHSQANIHNLISNGNGSNYNYKQPKKSFYLNGANKNNLLNGNKENEMKEMKEKKKSEGRLIPNNIKNITGNANSQGLNKNITLPNINSNLNMRNSPMGKNTYANNLKQVSGQGDNASFKLKPKKIFKDLKPGKAEKSDRIDILDTEKNNLNIDDNNGSLDTNMNKI